MITAQDIQDKTFAKALNGYNMDQVDEFLEELSAEITNLAKENTALKSKMRILVEKVEEYRQTEDSMRLALLSAQKMGSQIETEAQAKADTIVAQARETADRLTRQATDGIANEEAKLEEAKKATDKFFEHMRAVCEKQIEFYDKLSRMRLVGGDEPAPAQAPAAAPAAAPAPAPVVPIQKAAPSLVKEQEVAETVKSIETSVEKAALDEPEQTLVVDTEIPEEEEEPTRRFDADAPAKKKRGFDDFRFDDDI
jgi:cell division initiation protein